MVRRTVSLWLRHCSPGGQQNSKPGKILLAHNLSHGGETVPCEGLASQPCGALSMRPAPGGLLLCTQNSEEISKAGSSRESYEQRKGMESHGNEPGHHELQQMARRAKQPEWNWVTSLTLQNVENVYKPEIPFQERGREMALVPIGQESKWTASGKRERWPFGQLAWLHRLHRGKIIKILPSVGREKSGTVTQSPGISGHRQREKDWLALNTWYGSRYPAWLYRIEEGKQF